MKAFVTGVAGFVGSHLTRELLARGHEVTGIDSFTDYYDPAIKRRNTANLERARIVEADLNEADLRSLLSGHDVVFHQAGQPGVRKSWGSDFREYISANIAATQKLLEAAVETPSLKRLVYASSSSIYGNAERYPTSELDRPEPVSPYGVTKLAAEHLCTLYAKNFGLPTVSLRYFTVYGPGQRPDMAFTRFTRAAVCDEEIVIYGDGTQVRDFTFVEDVVEANIAAGESTVQPGSIYNVAGGTSVDVNTVLKQLSEIAGHELRVRHEGKVSGDVWQTGGATTAIQTDIGWQPKVRLAEGLEAHYAWAQDTFGNA